MDVCMAGSTSLNVGDSRKISSSLTASFLPCSLRNREQRRTRTPSATKSSPRGSNITISAAGPTIFC